MGFPSKIGQFLTSFPMQIAAVSLQTGCRYRLRSYRSDRQGLERGAETAGFTMEIFCRFRFRFCSKNRGEFCPWFLLGASKIHIEIFFDVMWKNGLTQPGLFITSEFCVMFLVLSWTWWKLDRKPRKPIQGGQSTIHRDFSWPMKVKSRGCPMSWWPEHPM